MPIQLRKAAKFRLEDYGVTVTDDDPVVGQMTEERRFLFETWHKVGWIDGDERGRCVGVRSG